MNKNRARQIHEEIEKHKKNQEKIMLEVENSINEFINDSIKNNEKRGEMKYNFGWYYAMSQLLYFHQKYDKRETISHLLVNLSDQERIIINNLWAFEKIHTETEKSEIAKKRIEDLTTAIGMTTEEIEEQIKKIKSNELCDY